MKVIDVIFGLACGRVIGFLVGDFLHEWGISVGFWYSAALWLAFPFITLLCLYLAQIVGRRLPVMFQAAKFVLVGAFATVVDLKFFEWLVYFISFVITVNPIASKAASFLVATAIKYWGNKYWAFGKHENEELHREISVFFGITLVGLLIDVAVFYYFTAILGAPSGIPEGIWLKCSVILAALVAALSNFLGYKFLVFKK